MTVLQRHHVNADRHRSPQPRAAHRDPLAQGRGWNDVKLSPWQLCEVREAIELLEQERFAEGERTMSEVELPNLYEPPGYVANEEPIDHRHLVDQLAAVVAAA